MSKLDFPVDYEGEHIEFRSGGLQPSAKTKLWYVYNKSETSPLGTVKWSGAWRKYVFVSNGGCSYEEVCLRDIASFLVDMTKEHRAK